MVITLDQLKTSLQAVKRYINKIKTTIISVIAEEFDASSSYSSGDYVYYNGKLYKFTADHATGVFDGTDAVEVTVADELANNYVTFDDYATQTVPGLVKVLNGDNVNGIKMAGGVLATVPSTSENIKNGITSNKPLVPRRQHESTFYGLAKAAGDTTQSASTNAVGTYTDEAKTAIQTMLGISNPQRGVDYWTPADQAAIVSAVRDVIEVAVSGTNPVITANVNTRYTCGEVSTLDFTPCASGICDVVFTSGSTPTVVAMPSTVKFPDGSFTPEANKTYEINILNGVYGAVMAWT